MSPPHASVSPPDCLLHPLDLLDAFLDTIKEGSEKATAVSTAVRGVAPEVSLDAQRDGILRVADYLYGGSVLEAALAVLDTDDAIRHVRAEQSQRQAFLVKSASTRQSSTIPTHYLCLSSGGLLFCSCRSYFERAKLDPKGICKHLLAVKLMPHLLDRQQRTQIVVPDAEFSTMLLKRIMAQQSS